MENKLETLQKVIESRLDIKLKKNTRKKEYIFARALFYALAYDGKRFTYTTIGKYMGKDHATVLHSIKNVFPQIMFHNKYKSVYDELSLIVGDGIDEKTLITHQDGIYNLYQEMQKKDDIIQDLSLKLILAEKANNRVSEVLKDLTPEETETLLDKMILTSKVIRNHRVMDGKKKTQENLKV